MGSQRGPRDHDHPVGNVGREPRTGRRLLILRWRLTTSLRSSVNSFHSAAIKGWPSGRPVRFLGYEPILQALLLYLLSNRHVHKPAEA